METMICCPLLDAVSPGVSPPASTGQHSSDLGGFDPRRELHKQHSGALRGRRAPGDGSGGWGFESLAARSITTGMLVDVYGRSARVRVWATASTAWTTAAITSRATWVGPPPAKQDRNRRRWLPSNQVIGDGLASRPGRTRRPPPNRHRDYCGRCRPCRRTPTSRSAGFASKRAATAGRALPPHPGQLFLSLPTSRGPPYSYLASRWRRFRCDRRATPSAEPPTRPAARLERGVPARAGTRDRPVAARGP
jgi:hypothetical protein